MNLVIDIGNSFTKVGVFKDDELLLTEQFEGVNEREIKRLLFDYPLKKAIISSVKKDKDVWGDALAGKVEVMLFGPGMTKGITNHYRTPETLGADRLAAVVGARYLYPGKGSLVISGGTAITYDWIDAAGNYFGGSISPGLNMRYKALNNYTDGLPLVSADENFNGKYGDSTANAIRSGVQNGIRYELTGFVESYKNKENELNIVLSGGDSIFFDTLLKNSIFAPYIKIEPYLVLKGLNAAIHNSND